MSSSVALTRAKRRYKILRREQADLSAKNARDSMIDDELEKLELEYPELKADSSSSLEPAPSKPTDEPPLVAARARGSSSHSAHVVPTTVKEGREPTPFPPTGSLSSQAPPTTSSSPNAENQSSPSSRGPPHLELFSTWFVRLYTAAHHRSFFGPLNFVKVIVTSSLIAAVHCFLVSPCSDLGASIQPSFVCIMIHISNLYSHFLRRREAMTLPMLIVYFIFDVAPSFATALVSYSVTVCILNLCGVPRLPVACPT